MANDMQLQGFAELAKALKELGPRVAKNTLRRAVSAGAARVRDTAKVFAPELTGKTKRAVAIKRNKDTRGEMAAKYSVYVRKVKPPAGESEKSFNPHYWFYHEFGTSKMPAQPFLRPAFESEKEAAVEDIGRVLDEGIQKAAAELAGRR